MQTDLAHTRRRQVDGVLEFNEADVARERLAVKIWVQDNLVDCKILDAAWVFVLVQRTLADIDVSDTNAKARNVSSAIQIQINTSLLTLFLTPGGGAFFLETRRARATKTFLVQGTFRTVR